ncbi:MAG: PLD nuclease N-terminal domain-containing protein [Bilophila wadsworthia]
MDRHAFNHTFETPLERVLWMVACVFVPVLGGVAYVLFGWRRAH